MEEEDKEVQLARLAKRQLGLVTMAQVIALGFNRKYVRHRLELRQWRRIFRGVYATNLQTFDVMRKHAAALLAAGPDSFLSHESAAHWLKITVLPKPAIQVSVPRTDSTLRLKDVDLHWRPTLAMNNVQDRGPIRLTTRGMTILDLAGEYQPADLKVSVYSCLREDPNNLALINKTLAAEGAGKPGAAALRAVLAEIGPRQLPESVGSQKVGTPV